VSDAVLEQFDGQRAWATPHGKMQAKVREQRRQVNQFA